MEIKAFVRRTTEIKLCRWTEDFNSIFTAVVYDVAVSLIQYGRPFKPLW